VEHRRCWDNSDASKVLLLAARAALLLRRAGFVVLPGGHLLAAKGSPFTGQGLGHTLIGSTPISGGGADIGARLSPDGSYLLIDGSGNHILSVFAVTGGPLTEVPSSPASLPAGGSPAGIVNI
jgi:hypothetical protein